MKRKIFLIYIFIFSVHCSGKIFIGEKYILGEKKVIKEELFILSEKIEIEGNAENEIIGMAKKVRMKGKVKGDAILAGENIYFCGKCGSDVYLVGEKINLESKIKGSGTVIGREIVIENTEIGGNLRIVGSKIFIKGKVKGDTTIWGNEISIEGNFSDVTIYGRKISLTKDTTVKGDLIYHSEERIFIPKGVEITGKIMWKEPVSLKVKKRIINPKTKRLFSFFSLLIPFILMNIFTPNLLSQTVILTGKNFFKYFLLGIGLIVLSFIIIILTFLTVFGAPFALIISSFFFSFLYIARGFPAIFIGRKILKKLPDRKSTWVLSTILGIIILVILISIPKIGIIFNLFFLPLGFGSLVIGRLQFFKKLRQEKIL